MKSRSIIDMLRKKYPGVKWEYNRVKWRWESNNKLIATKGGRWAVKTGKGKSEMYNLLRIWKNNKVLEKSFYKRDFSWMEIKADI